MGSGEPHRGYVVVLTSSSGTNQVQLLAHSQLIHKPDSHFEVLMQTNADLPQGRRRGPGERKASTIGVLGKAKETMGSHPSSWIWI